MMHPPTMTHGRHTLIILATVGLLMGVVYAFLPLTGPDRYLSPDETANAFFASRFAEQRALTSELPVPSTAGVVAIPRNALAVDGRMAPLGFVGHTLLVGGLTWAVGDWSLRLWTAVLTVLAVIASWPFFCSVFGRRTGTLTVLALFISPPLWYWASHEMVANVLFVDAIIAAFGVGASAVRRRSAWRASAAGLLLGIAVSLRMNEAVWIALLGIGVCWPLRRMIGRRAFLWAAGGAVLGVLPTVVANAVIYGSPFSVGYDAADATGVFSTFRTSTFAGQGGLRVMRTLFFPFGIDAREAWANAVAYLWTLLPWVSLLTIWGVLRTALQMRVQRVHRRYVATLALLTAYLCVYYGSGAFFGSARYGAQPILGASFLRYWLVLYVFLTPFLVLGIQALLQAVRRSFLQRLITASTVVVVVVLAAHTVFADPSYGLIQSRENLRVHEQTLEDAARLIPPNAVIITATRDKEFFPTYAVIGFGERSGNRTRIEDALPQLVREVPLFLIEYPGERADIRLSAEARGLHIHHVGALRDGTVVSQLLAVSSGGDDGGIVGQTP